MTSLTTAWAHTLEFEGGYQNNPSDIGNYCGYNSYFGLLVGTNHGITCDTYKAYYGYYPSIAQMMALTNVQAGDIAKYLIWDKYNLSLIPHQKIATQVFDILFHFSFSSASRIIQQSIIDSGGYLYDGVDKIFGPDTLQEIINLINKGQAEELNQNIIKNQLEHYSNRVNQDITQSEYYDGWVRRARSHYFEITKGISKPIIAVGLLSIAAYFIFNNS